MKRYLIALLFLFTTFAGCASSSGDQTALAASQKTLTSYYWQLQEAKDAQGTSIPALFVQADKPIQIEFSNNSYFNISNTCNNMSGSYTLNKKELILGAVFATKKMCDDKLDTLDHEVGKRLQDTISYHITSDREKSFLTLTVAKGDTLKFIGIPTPETRFNSKGETVFLEIAPQKTPCHQSDSSAKECFQVRQVYYDDNGIKSQKSGLWSDLDKDIEGFQFQPGIRNILRVKKYHIASSSEKTADTVYVLDMVIESENVRLKK